MTPDSNQSLAQLRRLLTGKVEDNPHFWGEVLKHIDPSEGMSATANEYLVMTLARKGMYSSLAQVCHLLSAEWDQMKPHSAFHWGAFWAYGGPKLWDAMTKTARHEMTFMFLEKLLIALSSVSREKHPICHGLLLTADIDLAMNIYGYDPPLEVIQFSNGGVGLDIGVAKLINWSEIFGSEVPPGYESSERRDVILDRIAAIHVRTGVDVMVNGWDPEGLHFGGA